MRRNPPTGRRCGCCVKCGKNSTCAMQMLSWRRSMHTMGKRGKALRSSAAGGNPRHCPRRDGSIIRVCVQPASMCWANTGRDIGGRERAGRDRSRQSAGYDGQLMRKRTKFLSADARRNLDGIREHQMRTSGHEHSAGGKPAGVQRRSTLVSVQRRSL